MQQNLNLVTVFSPDFDSESIL